MSKSYDVSREEVDNAWKAVRKADGTAGFDGKSIEEVEANLDGELYKIWNRLSSGSYIPAPVLLVNIPKVKHIIIHIFFGIVIFAKPLEILTLINAEDLK